MEVINKITVDLVRPGVKPMISAMQGDENTRVLEVTLNANGTAWKIPTGVRFSMAYKKPDGTKGIYDTMPDGSSAASAEGSVVSIRLAPQMLAVPGAVSASVVISDGDNRLHTFPVFVNVIQNPAVNAVSEDYFSLAGIGNLNDLKTNDKSSLVAAINEIVLSGGSDYVLPIAGTELGGVKNGGNVVINEDGTMTAPDSGQNLDLTFHNGRLYITVNGVRTGNGVVIGTVEETVYHNIVMNLTNCVSSNDAVRAEEHSTYTTVISPEIGFIMNSLTVTMGGEALTPENGTIHIEDVTGEIQITASAVENTGGVDLSGIVAWYQTEVQDAYNYISAMDSSKWVHHVVLADTHYNFYQYGNSAEIVKALMDTGKFDKFIHLGDLVDVLTDGNWQSVLDDGYERFNGKMLFAYGNHDNNIHVGNVATSFDVYKTALLSQGNFTWYDGVEYCYYYDDTVNKIRYVCLNLWAGADNVTAQINWLNGLLAEMTGEWSAFVFVHGEVSNDRFYNGLLFSDVNVGGVIEGHWHSDRLFDTKKVNRIRLLCDRGGEPGPVEDEVHLAPTERVQGTKSEHAITIMSINPTERKVVFYRIGAYAEYYNSVAPKILEYTYDSGDTVYWNDGYWKDVGIISPNPDGYLGKYETKLRSVKSGDVLYIHCVSGESTMTEILVANFNSNNASDFRGRSNGSIENRKLDKTFGYITPGDGFVSISVDGWDTGEYAITANPDDLGFSDKPTAWEAGYVGSNGQLSPPDNATVAYSNMIKVKPNTTYRIGSTGDALDWVGIGTYKAPYLASFISRLTSATFTTQSDCNYVILSAVGVIGNEENITFEEVTS